MNILPRKTNLIHLETIFRKTALPHLDMIEELHPRKNLLEEVPRKTTDINEIDIDLDLNPNQIMNILLIETHLIHLETILRETGLLLLGIIEEITTETRESQ